MIVRVVLVVVLAAATMSRAAHQSDAGGPIRSTSELLQESGEAQRTDRVVEAHEPE